MLKPLAVSLALMASLPALAEGGLQVSKITGTATLNQSGKNKPAEVKLMLRTGDVLTAGAQSRAGLSFGKTGEFVLAGLSELQVYEANAGSKQTPALAKLKLLAGAIKVKSTGKPAQDVRLNVGLLKTRIFDAEVWGASTTEGDTVCLIRGAVEIQSSGSEAPTRLATEGSCLRREPDGKTVNIRAASDEILPAAIAATAFPPEALAQASAAVALPPPRPTAAPVANKVPPPSPAPVAVPAAKSALPAEATIKAPAVMVPSAPKAESAAPRAVVDASATPTVTARAQGQVLIQTPVQTIVQSAPIIEKPDPATKAKLKAEIAAKPVVKVVPGKPAPAAPAAPAAKPTPAPAAVVAMAKPAVATSAAATSSGRWTVVVMSSPNQTSVQARTNVMQDQGFIANLRTAEVKGQTYYRVTIGEFASREEAAAYAKHTLAKSGIEGWLSPI